MNKDDDIITKSQFYKILIDNLTFGDYTQEENYYSRISNIEVAYLDRICKMLEISNRAPHLNKSLSSSVRDMLSAIDPNSNIKFNELKKIISKIDENILLCSTEIIENLKERERILKQIESDGLFNNTVGGDSNKNA